MAFTWSDPRPSDFINPLVVFANSSPSLLSKVANSSTPIGSELDKVDSTLTKLRKELPWDQEAKDILEKIVAKHSPLTRISATKTLRDQAEKIALENGEKKVAKEILKMLNPEDEEVNKSNKVA